MSPLTYYCQNDGHTQKSVPLSFLLTLGDIPTYQQQQVGKEEEPEIYRVPILNERLVLYDDKILTQVSLGLRSRGFISQFFSRRKNPPLQYSYSSQTILLVAKIVRLTNDHVPRQLYLEQIKISNLKPIQIFMKSISGIERHRNDSKSGEKIGRELHSTTSCQRVVCVSF